MAGQAWSRRKTGESWVVAGWSAAEHLVGPWPSNTVDPVERRMLRDDMPMSLPEVSSSEMARELASEFDAWRRGVGERLTQPTPESPPAAPPPAAPPQAAAEPQPAAEPQLPAEPTPNAPLRFGPRPRPGAREPLLKRSTRAAQSSASREYSQRSAG